MPAADRSISILSLDVEPRVVLSLQDRLDAMADDWEEPEDLYRLDLYFNWQLPSLANPPDLLVMGTDLAGVGGVDLPIKVAAAESIASITDASERTVQVVGQCQVSLVDVLMGREQFCEELDRAKAVSEYLFDRVTGLDGATRGSNPSTQHLRRGGALVRSPIRG